MTSPAETLAIDIGGVIIGPATADVLALNSGFAHLALPEIDGAIDAIARLVKERFGPERTCIISRASGQGPKDRLEWLKARYFHARTGIRPDRIFFCQAKIPKAGLCVENGVTHIVDNRITVLESVPMVANKCLFQQRPFKPDEIDRLCRVSNVQIASSWDDVLALLLPGGTHAA